MDRLVREMQHPRLVTGPLPQPPQRIIRELIRDVAALRHAPAVDVKPVFARQVAALALEADPVVEARLRRVPCLPHVPLADQSGVVSRRLQILRIEHQPGRHWVLVVDHGAGERRAP